MRRKPAAATGAWMWVHQDLRVVRWAVLDDVGIPHDTAARAAASCGPQAAAEIRPEGRGPGPRSPQGGPWSLPPAAQTARPYHHLASLSVLLSARLCCRAIAEDTARAAAPLATAAVIAVAGGRCSLAARGVRPEVALSRHYPARAYP